MKNKNLLGIYRIIHTDKISSLRLLGYTVFGLAITGQFMPLLYFLDLVAIFFLLLSASFFNNYYDWKILGEKNYLSENNIQNISYGVIPLVISLAFFAALIILKPYTLALIPISFSIVAGLLYSTPPVRLKSAPIINFFIPPLAIYGLFLQALLLAGGLDLYKIFIAILVFIFAFYLEFLHLLDDLLRPHETYRVSKDIANSLARAIAGIGILFSLTASYFYPIFAISIVAWSLRLLALLRTPIEKIPVLRRNILSPLWRLEDFMIYGLRSIIQLI